MSSGIIVIGSGGHAAVIVDALLTCGTDVLGLTDADTRRRGADVCGRPVLGDDSALAGFDARVVQLVNGIGSTGDCRVRRELQARLEGVGWRFSGVRHPSAVVSRFARIAADAQLLARSVVQARAVVGAGCVINTGAVVEHDVELGAYAHVAPGAIICGDARIGAHSHVGAGAVVLQGIRVGDATLIAAGAVVIRDHPGGGVLAGLPAASRERSK